MMRGGEPSPALLVGLTFCGFLGEEFSTPLGCRKMGCLVAVVVCERLRFVTFGI